jgi:hypothetical protein
MFFDSMFSGADFRALRKQAVKPADFKAGLFGMLFLAVA